MVSGGGCHSNPYLQLEDFTVHHMGAVTGEHCSCLSEDFGSSCVSSMHTIVRRSTYKTKPATGNETGRMVAVAMESTLNTQRNTKVDLALDACHTAMMDLKRDYLFFSLSPSLSSPLFPLLFFGVDQQVCRWGVQLVGPLLCYPSRGGLLCAGELLPLPHSDAGSLVSPQQSIVCCEA